MTMTMRDPPNPNLYAEEVNKWMRTRDPCGCRGSLDGYAEPPLSFHTIELHMLDLQMRTPKLMRN